MARTGWRVTAVLAEKRNRTGVKISEEKMAGFNLDRDKTPPQWN